MTTPTKEELRYMNENGLEMKPGNLYMVVGFVVICVILLVAVIVSSLSA